MTFARNTHGFVLILDRYDLFAEGLDWNEEGFVLSGEGFD
jgi:hypothetical protein